MRDQIEKDDNRERSNNPKAVRKKIYIFGCK